MKKTAELIRLVKNLLIVAVIATLGYLIYRYFSGGNDDDLLIDDTGMRIEAIKTIAEISTIIYTDEVVMDTIERYDKSPGVLEQPFAAYYRNIKRRLTLIVHGNVRYGLDLTSGNYFIESNQDSIWLTLPKARILDIEVTPTDTEVFEEIGTWPDGTRQRLEMKAKLALKKNSLLLKLEEKAQKNAERIFRKMVPTDKKLIIKFE